MLLLPINVLELNHPVLRACRKEGPTAELQFFNGIDFGLESEGLVERIERQVKGFYYFLFGEVHNELVLARVLGFEDAFAQVVHLHGQSPGLRLFLLYHYNFDYSEMKGGVYRQDSEIIYHRTKTYLFLVSKNDVVRVEPRHERGLLKL
jgi:hypothetical protein